MGVVLLQRRRRRPLPGLLERKRPRPAEHAARLRAVELDARAAGALTLEDLIVGAWEGLSVCETVRCPVCGERMVRRGEGTTSCDGVPGGVQQGECVDCGTRLS
jgi:hypothetical protein